MNLTNTQKQFSILFIMIVLFEQVTSAVPNLIWAHYIAKPAIVMSLIFLFQKESENIPSKQKGFVLFALFFSVVGDILLMFTEKSELFFIFGLVAFLIAHCCYTLVFFKQRTKGNWRLYILMMLIVYAGFFLALIKSSLANLLLPVVLYILVILTMAYTSFLRKGAVSQQSYLLVVIGALLFLISDSSPKFLSN